MIIRHAKDLQRDLLHGVGLDAFGKIKSKYRFAYSPPGGSTAYQLLHRSINHQVAKNDANLSLSPSFAMFPLNRHHNENSHRRNFSIDEQIRSELNDLSDDANKTGEWRILEGESSSDESDEETHGNI
ncbi:hypothetical protein TNCV_5079181 [Trichonephila clavipes]|nr:hypothetical protein TNCV_5079181 [Trichonephila clavipes]